MILCKTCGNPENNHPYRHPFVPQMFNMPVVLPTPINWHRRFLELARHFASWSKDPSTQVGAVIVNDKRQVLGHGYNGFPRGVDDSPERYNDRPTKYAHVVHAELNAILNTGDRNALEGSTLYCTHFPCGECAKAIIQAGIKAVFVPRDSRLCRWAEGHEVADTMFEEAGIETSTVA